MVSIDENLLDEFEDTVSEIYTVPHRGICAGRTVDDD